MLLTLQLEPFSLWTPKHFVHGEVSIQLQGLWQDINTLNRYLHFFFFPLKYEGAINLNLHSIKKKC